MKRCDYPGCSSAATVNTPWGSYCVFHAKKVYQEQAKKAVEVKAAEPKPKKTTKKAFKTAMKSDR